MADRPGEYYGDSGGSSGSSYDDRYEQGKQEIDLRQKLMDYWRQTPEGAATLSQIEASGGFEDRRLNQALEIARMNESGANSRARTAAGASTRNAQIAASASRYSADTQRKIADADRVLKAELGRGELGLGVLGLGSQLSGPANYLSYVNLMRNAPAMGSAAFLNTLTGSVPGLFGKPGGTPDPMNLQALVQQLGGSGGGGVASGGSGNPQLDQAQQFQENVAGLLSQGVHKFRPGSLESLNPSELGLLQGAAGKAGYNWTDLVNQYQQSGIGQ